jgi:hypothetical protein
MRVWALSRGLLLTAVGAASAMSQTVSANGTTTVIPVPAGGVVAQMGIAGGFAGGGPLSSVAGKPYSAQQETQTIQTLADGTHITNGSQKVMTYRDSLGRTRVERTAVRPPGFMSEGSSPPVFIEVTDPVAGYRYSFDSNTKTAHRSQIGHGKVLTTIAPPPSPPPPGAAAVQAFQSGPNSATAQRPRPEISREPLGTQTMEGVLATGTRTTTTYPVGFFGNDRPITTTRETWMSRDLGMAILTKTSDPRSGETTMRVTNISLTEPDPSLFQPPADYEIVDPQK